MKKTFNYPVSIKNNIAFSSKPLKINGKFFGSVTSNKLKSKIQKSGLYETKISYKPDFSFEKEQSKLWAELQLSFDNYEISLDWINGFDLFKNMILSCKNLLTPTEYEILIEIVLKRPEEDYVSYIQDSFLINGCCGILEKEVHIDLIKVPALEVSRNTYFKKIYPVINCYYHKIDNACYINSLVKKFLIKTSGFNQDFKYDNHYYSSVALIKQKNKEFSYKIYIYGCDDSSYTKYCKTLKEAKEQIYIIKSLAKVIRRSHLEKLGYEFTN